MSGGGGRWTLINWGKQIRLYWLVVVVGVAGGGVGPQFNSGHKCSV